MAARQRFRSGPWSLGAGPRVDPDRPAEGRAGAHRSAESAGGFRTRLVPPRGSVLAVLLIAFVVACGSVIGLLVTADASPREGSGSVPVPGFESRAAPRRAATAKAPSGGAAGTDARSSPAAGSSPRPSGAGAVTASGMIPSRAIPPSLPGAAAPASTADAVATRILVDVAGAVKSPGVVELAAGSRIGDAIDAAHGPTSKADLASVNQARPLGDGEQVFVPENGGDRTSGAPPPTAGGGGSATPGATPGAVPGPGATAGSAGAASDGSGSGGPVNVNSADAAALQTLPGIGPALSGRIIEQREQHGPFPTVDALAEVRGIGPKILESLRTKVTV